MGGDVRLRPATGSWPGELAVRRDENRPRHRLASRLRAGRDRSRMRARVGITVIACPCPPDTQEPLAHRRPVRQAAPPETSAEGPAGRRRHRPRTRRGRQSQPHRDRTRFLVLPDAPGRSRRERQTAAGPPFRPSASARSAAVHRRPGNRRHRNRVTRRPQTPDLHRPPRTLLAPEPNRSA